MANFFDNQEKNMQLNHTFLLIYSSLFLIIVIGYMGNNERKINVHYYYTKYRGGIF